MEHTPFLPEKPRVALLGATGLIGQTLLRILEERQFPMSSLCLLASRKSQGKLLSYGSQAIPVGAAELEDFEGIDLVFSAMSEDQARLHLPRAEQAGCWIIDKSSAFRLDPEIVLMVPECWAPHPLFDNTQNPSLSETLQKQKRRLIASPNCVAAPLALALWPLQCVYGIQRLFVSTYQSASGEGKKGIEAILRESKQKTGGLTHVMPQMGHQASALFGAPLFENVIPCIGTILPNKFSTEEEKIQAEVRKILKHPELPIHLTCVRVPVIIGHSMVITVAFERPCHDSEALRELLEEMPGLHVWDRKERIPGSQAWATPQAVAGEDSVFVSRIRLDDPYHASFWICSDNTRKGAALNAVQIAEDLLACNQSMKAALI